jgi:hypothetical protein
MSTGQPKAVLRGWHQSRAGRFHPCLDDHSLERSRQAFEAQSIVYPAHASSSGGKLFDPRYFCYWEESDWFERCAASGWHVALSPRAVLIHAQGGSGSDAFELFHVLRNWRIYLKDHRSRPVRLFARVALWAFVLRVAITSTQNGNWRLSLVALQASVARLPACCSEAIAAAAPFSAPAVSAKWS